MVVGRKRERGDWGDASFGNPPPNKIPRPRIGEESLRVLTRSSVGKAILVSVAIFFVPGRWFYHWQRWLKHKTS